MHKSYFQQCKHKSYDDYNYSINSQLRAQEANEYGNMKILSLNNVTAGHDDFPLGRVSI